MLQAATVASGTLGLLGRLQAEPLLCSTRLVGGTALSLQIGHRVSDDFLFSAMGHPFQQLAEMILRSSVT